MSDVMAFTKSELIDLLISNEVEILKDDRIEFSPLRRYFVKYSKTDSSISFYLLNDRMKPERLEVLDKHSCTILKVLFMGCDNWFISLDSGSKLKIWLWKNESLKVIQTIKKDYSFDKSDYITMSYSADLCEVALSTRNRTDIFLLKVKNYKPNIKNELLQFLRSEEQQVPEVSLAEEIQRLGCYVIDSRTESSPSHHPDSSSVKMKTTSKSNVNPESKSTLGHGRISDQQLKNVQYSEAQMKRQEALGSIETSSSKFRRASANVYVGVDLGTSSTKLSFYSDRTEQYEVIVWNECKKSNHTDEFEEWEIPSQLSISGDYRNYGVHTLGQPNVVKDLKRNVLREKSNDVDIMNCASFLAYVFLRTEEHLRDELNLTDEALISFTICLPVIKMNNNSEVISFKRTLAFAEVIRDDKILNSTRSVEKAYEQFKTTNNEGKTQFTDVVPESVAEIIDFAQNPDNYGLYALYDFGAGSTELTIFRINSVNVVIPRAEIVLEGFSDVKGYQGKSTDIKAIEKFYRKIWKKFEESGIWEKLYNKDYLGDQRGEFFKDIHILASGGGSYCKEILRIFSEIPLFIKDIDTGENKLNRIAKQIPTPQVWDHDPPYPRFAVSFGLSNDPKQTNDKCILPKDAKPTDTGQCQAIERSEDAIHNNNKNWLN